MNRFLTPRQRLWLAADIALSGAPLLLGYRLTRWGNPA